MRQYLDLLKKVLGEGDPQYNSRTGQLMIVSAGEQSKYDLRQGLPLCTTKPVSMRWVGEEVFWILRGERNAKSLYDKGIDIWNRNAFQHYLKRNGLEEKIPKNTPTWNDFFTRYETAMKENRKFEIVNNRAGVAIADSKISFNLEDSDLGPVYGHQLRHWTGKDGKEVDQLKKVVNLLKKDKGSRYSLFSMWNPAELDEMALGQCHILTHFTVTNNRDLDLHMFQRSCDVFLGVPFNIAQYSLINHLVANETGLQAKRFIHTYSNVHIYCGVPPRSDFVRKNLEEIQEQVRWCAENPENYLKVRDWYLQNAPAESPGNERKDHIPFILQQLSHTPRRLPTIQLQNMPLFEIINRSAKEVITVEGYEPIKWDSKAVMAA